MDMLFGKDLGSTPLPTGTHHLPGWLDLRQQAWIVAQTRMWARGPVPPHSPSINGHPMSVRTLCLGWHWSPYQYTRRAIDVNGAKVLPLPDWLVRLGQRAVAAAEDEKAGHAYLPDAALVNYYPPGATMGMHQDNEELSPAPVVSLSIGDTCTFRVGNTENRNRPYRDIQLRSGDLFVFGGPARRAFHGVPKVLTGTAPADCGLSEGRINITLRVTGLEDPPRFP